MEIAIGHVQTQISDEAWLRLHDALAKRNAPKPGSFASLDQDQRREYFRVARQRSRAKVKTAEANGGPAPTMANVRDALADAALMILATSAPGTKSIRKVLRQIFATRPGVPMTVEAKAKRGKLKPKLIPTKVQK